MDASTRAIEASEERAREYLATQVEPLMTALLRKLAIDRPNNPTAYLLEHLRQSEAATAVARLRHPTKAAMEPAVEEEKDTMEAEDKFDLNALLLPDGYLPTNRPNFGVLYNMEAFRGWVRQTSPACAAASVAGAWNSLLADSEGRESCYALQQHDVVAVYVDMLTEQVEARRARLERLLGGPLDAIEKRVVELLKDVGRSLGGKGDAGCPKSEILKYVRWAVDQTSGSSPEGAVLALSELFQEADAEASTANAKDDDDGADADEPEGAEEKSEAGGGLKTWRKEIKTLFGKLGGLEKIKRPNPSTADFGNWAILQAVARLSGGRELPLGMGITATVAVGKKIKGRTDLEITISPKDSEEVIAEQWGKLRTLFGQQNSAIIFHLKNHYALLYAMREWAAQDPAEPPVREMLTARRGQRPSQWISWEEARGIMLRWNGHVMIRVKRTLAPTASSFCARG